MCNEYILLISINQNEYLYFVRNNPFKQVRVHLYGLSLDRHRILDPLDNFLRPDQILVLDLTERDPSLMVVLADFPR